MHVCKNWETFDDYFSRKPQVFNTHSGNEQPTDATDDIVWERLFVQTLVDGLSPGIRAIFVRHCVAAKC